MRIHHLLAVLLIITTIMSACSPTQVGATAFVTQPSISTATNIPEEISIATEQAMAMAVKTEGALTFAAQPTFTLQPTQTSVPAHLPTLTPIANSTPAQKGAFFDVPPDVLGSRYAIENACYFDTQSGWERYEIYAGAIAGSGDEYSAQGVAIVRIFRATEQGGSSSIEIANTKEYLTSINRGPLKLDTFGNCSPDLVTLATPLNFIWFLHPPEEFYQYNGAPPLARLEAGGTTQIAELGSYCWNGGCLDGPGISTSTTPLVIRSGSTAHLHLPLEEPPDGLELHVMLVSPPGNLQYDYGLHGNSADWSFEKEGRPLSKIEVLALRREQDIKIDLDPGYYVLVFLAAWQDYGDVKYGILVELK